MLGFGLFTLLHEHSSKAEWVIFQALWAFGTGSLIVTILPAIQVGLPEKDVAASMGVFSFFRSFGGIWGIVSSCSLYCPQTAESFVGVSIATTVFDSRVNGLLHRLNNLPGGSDVAGALRDGGAYESATPAFLNTLAQMPRTLDAVLSIYDDALRLVWQVGLGFAGFAFLLTLLLKQMNLRTEIETDFGLETKDNKKS